MIYEPQVFMVDNIQLSYPRDKGFNMFYFNVTYMNFASLGLNM